MPNAENKYREEAAYPAADPSAYLPAKLRVLKRERLLVVSLLSAALLATLTYGTLENPFHYSFSNIGNYFPYREWYIIWAAVTGFFLYFSVISLFRLEKYKQRFAHLSISVVPLFLVVTALIPSVSEEMPFWHVLHRWTTFFFVMCMIFSVHPFLLYLGDKKPWLSDLLRNWQLVILAGSMASLILQGQTGIFELWFFVTTIILLIYLSWILYTENIEAYSEVVESLELRV